MRSLKEELAGVQREMDRFLAILASEPGASIPPILERLRDLSERRDAIAAQLREMETRPAGPASGAAEHLRKALGDLSSLLPKLDDRALRRAIEQVVSRVVVR
ncbi:MAG TPA: hypothetical protein VIL95_04530, partial [Bacillota bacterium]